MTSSICAVGTTILIETGADVSWAFWVPNRGIHIRTSALHDMYWENINELTGEVDIELIGYVTAMCTAVLFSLSEGGVCSGSRVPLYEIDNHQGAMRDPRSPCCLSDRDGATIHLA